MAKMVKYRCVSRRGAQYKNPEGRNIFVKEGAIVVTDKMDLGAKGQLSKGWEIVEDTKAEDAGFEVKAEKKAATGEKKSK
jgi:hypothetical protein